MFTYLTLKNFKTWRECDVHLAPVTLLLGANSSGKSSILQSLLLLKQTAASPDRTVHLNLGGDEVNDYFNFGNFNDVLTRLASPQEFGISVGIEYLASDPADRFKPLQKIIKRLAELKLSYRKNSAGAPIVQSFAMSDDDREFRLARGEKGAYKFYIDNEPSVRGNSRNFSPERSIALSADALQLLGPDAAVAQDLSLLLRRELESIAYLGPLRQGPKRDYSWNKSKPGQMGADGGGVMNALLASVYLRSTDEIATDWTSALAGSTDRDSRDLLKEVSTWLKRMGVAESIELKQLGHSSRYELIVHNDGIASNLRDVGIGVSQVLPVLTLAYFAKRGSTILLEEPEIHLHPLAQSVLADLFVKVAKERGIQFIVETHSEHIFRRMQTLIAQDKAKAADCRMYFVKRAKADARLISLELDDCGSVKNWPDTFFGDSLGEAREQALARLARMKKLANAG